MDKYDIIYADPPWQYKKYKGKTGHGKANDHYKVMNKQRIMDMGDQIRDIANKNAVLFMWGTPPAYEDALDVIKAWGFKYKTWGFLWVKYYHTKAPDFGTEPLILGEDNILHKPTFGMGSYTRGNPEPCLLATRGRDMTPVRRDIGNLIFAPREAHSKKPDEARRRIELLYPEHRKIELFARQRPIGWHTWGDEVHCDIELEVPNE